MEWQPIETAPKDGSWIIVTSTHNQYYRAAVMFDEWWQDSLEADHSGFMENSATHWMRLPEPPVV